MFVSIPPHNQPLLGDDTNSTALIRFRGILKSLNPESLKSKRYNIICDQSQVAKVHRLQTVISSDDPIKCFVIALANIG